MKGRNLWKNVHVVDPCGYVQPFERFEKHLFFFIFFLLPFLGGSVEGSLSTV